MLHIWRAFKQIVVGRPKKYELGRWNSHVHKKEVWEYYLDMANYDNCCCSEKKRITNEK